MVYYEILTNSGSCSPKNKVWDHWLYNFSSFSRFIFKVFLKQNNFTLSYECAKDAQENCNFFLDRGQTQNQSSPWILNNKIICLTLSSICLPTIESCKYYMGGNTNADAYKIAKRKYIYNKPQSVKMCSNVKVAPYMILTYEF